MNKEKLECLINEFEDAQWLKTEGISNRSIKDAVDDMSLDDMKWWIKDAMKLFNKLLNED